MKTRTLILSAVLIFSLCAANLYAAEQREVKRSYLGLAFGLNLGQFIGDNADAAEFYGGGEKKMRLGLAVGAFAHLGIGNYFALEPQVLYSQKGAKYGDAFPGWGDELTLILDYVEVPVLARIYITNSPKINIFGGGYFGYLLSAKYKYSEIGYEEEGDFLIQPEDIDYGLVLGAGGAFPTSTVILRIDLKYSLGLAKIWDMPPNDDIRNGVLSILASIGF